VIPRDSSAGVHYTFVDTSNPNFVDILFFFCSEVRQAILLKFVNRISFFFFLQLFYGIKVRALGISC